MLGILRGTHNALLFACIFLLVCSFERLSRYDFASLPPGEEQHIPIDDNNKARGEQPTSGEDHFVFWAGISSWERTVENGIFYNRLKSFIRSGSLGEEGSSGVAAPDVITSSLSKKMILNYREMIGPAKLRSAPTSSSPLAEVKLALRRQIRHSQKVHQQRISSKETVQEDEPGSSPQSTLESTKNQPPNPAIGFILHLNTCNRTDIGHWQKVWKQQKIDQAFLFFILMTPTVDDSCIEEVQSELRQQQASTRNVSKDDHTGMFVYQVSRNQKVIKNLRSCGEKDDLLNTLKLQEVLYHDGSKEGLRPETTSNTWHFQNNNTMHKQPVASFKCGVKENKKAARCENSVKACRSFQYAPRMSTNGTGASSGDTPSTPGLISSMESTTS